MTTNQNSQLIQSVCAYCGVGCGVDIKVADGKAMSLSGTADHPANYGRLCVKGTNLLETTSVDGRLLQPEISGQAVSWNDATQHVAQKFKQIIKQHGKDAIAFYVSGQLLTEDYYLANKLMKGYIGSANIDTNSRLCMSSAVTAYKRAFGEDCVPVNYQDLEKSEVIIITGSNAAWTHPVLFQRIERAKQINPKLKIVVIDPRKTATSALADFHLPLKPGTDAALFNGMLSYLANNKYLDLEFIAQSTQGFDETLAQAHYWTVPNVAKYCQLTTAQVTNIYQLFAKSQSAITFYSMGINQSTSGVDKCQAIINCHLASGKVGKIGSGPFSITGQPNAMGGREVGGLSNQLVAHMDLENSEHRQLVQEYWQSPTIASSAGYKAVDLFQAIANKKIKAVWIMATNPMVSLPNRANVEQALKQCEFVVVSDCVAKNDSLAFADVKLPATPWLEKDGTVTNSERRISRQRAAVAPAGQAKADWQIIAEVAQAMGFSGFNYNYVSEIFSEYAGLTAYKNNGQRLLDLSGLANLTPSQYQQLTPIQWPVNNKYPHGCNRLFTDAVFNTASKKARFIPITPKPPTQQPSAKYPFIVNSGRLRDQWHTMTRTSKSSKLMQHSPVPTVAMNSADAEKLSISPNELVVLHNDYGQVIINAAIDDGLRCGEVFVPIHWNLQFASSANISSLYAPCVDPLSGQPESKHAVVAIAKASFAQFGQLHVKQKLSVNTNFWVYSNAEQYHSYEIAVKSPINDLLSWCQHSTHLTGEWLMVNHDMTTTVLCVRDGQLLAFAQFGQQLLQQSPQWLEHVFSLSTIDGQEISALLSAQATQEFNSGKQICSCYQVGEHDIVAAINNGYQTVEQLGAQLKCGTNCGSCKAELSQLINQHSVQSMRPTSITKHLSIPIEIIEEYDEELTL